MRLILKGPPGAGKGSRRAQTAPLAEKYDARDLLVRVDGTGHVDHVTARVHDAITGPGPQPTASETRHDLAEPKRRKHLMVPGEARPMPRRPTSITTVQRWVITALLLVTTGILATGIVVIATLADLARPGARPGLLIIAAGFGVVAVGGCLLIHQRRPLSLWLLAGLLPSLVGAYFCYLA